MKAVEPPNEIQEFSLVKGGLVYGLFRRAGLCNEDLEPLFRSAEGYIRMWERAEVRAAALR